MKKNAHVAPKAGPNAGYMLARLRWDKASTEEKKRVNEMLLKARAKKREEKK